MGIEGFVLIAGVLLGGGGLAAFYGTHVTRKLGISSNETIAKRDVNTTWEAIVRSMQARQDASDKREEALNARMNALEERMEERQNASDAKERLLYQHIVTLEAGYPPPVPKRPEGI